MFKNNLPISTLLGMFIVGLGGLILALMIEAIQNRQSYDGDIDTEMILAVVANVVFIFIGIGFIAKVNWTRHILAALLTIFFVLIMYFTFPELTRMSSRVMLSNIMGLIMVIVSYLFSMLLIYNRKVSEEFGANISEKDLEDIIDFHE